MSSINPPTRWHALGAGIGAVLGRVTNSEYGLRLLLFGFVFAINSSVHSYLILAFAGSDRVSMDVGFYYMAHAAGRRLGTPLVWGGDWARLRDGPHFELDRGVYP